MKTNQLLGVVAGIAAGTLIGVLIAPAKGSETRKNLADRGRKVVDGLRNTVTELKGTVADTLESAGNLVSELSGQVTEKPVLNSGFKSEGVRKDQNNQGTNEKNHQHSQTNQNRH